MDDRRKRINEEALRLINRILSRHEIFRPGFLKPSSENPRELRVELDESRFEGAEEVYIDVQWYTDGDYNFHPEYAEERLPEGIQPDESFRHFHPPPDANYEPSVGHWKDDHVRDVIDHIRVWIDDRIRELWDGS